jgi:ankyrin repeat protein
MNKLTRNRQSRLPLLFSILAIGSPLLFSNPRTPAIARSLAAEMSTSKDLYRADGVRIGYNPYSPEMLEKYGSPGETDSEGFNPYADSVGAGIYGGRVKRDEKGDIIIGEQYQNHNTNPGPIYAGGGYTPMINALRLGEAEVGKLLAKFPDLVNEVSTGGATPLHMCGMSSQNQKVTAFLIQKGADIEAIDTYGFKPLHRMASNNLAIGAEALLAGKCL